MAKQNNDIYEKRVKKKMSELQPNVEIKEDNPFIKDYIGDEQKTTKKKTNFKGKSKKITESYYLPVDIVEIINQITAENEDLNKSIVVEQILREYFVKNGLMDKK